MDSRIRDNNDSEEHQTGTKLDRFEKFHNETPNCCFSPCNGPQHLNYWKFVVSFHLADPLMRMKDLLISWNLEKMYDNLVDFGFDYNSLQYIVEEDLVTVFNEKKFLGPLRLFRAKHSDWIKSLVNLLMPSI